MLAASKCGVMAAVPPQPPRPTSAAGQTGRRVFACDFALDGVNGLGLVQGMRTERSSGATRFMAAVFGLNPPDAYAQIDRTVSRVDRFQDKPVAIYDFVATMLMAPASPVYFPATGGIVLPVEFHSPRSSAPEPAGLVKALTNALSQDGAVTCRRKSAVWPWRRCRCCVRNAFRIPPQ